MSNAAVPGLPAGCLAGIRVLDLSIFLPGPFGTQMLADLGADVIKIESPAGDPGRYLPSRVHETADRNKRSVVLDLKTADGRERLRALAAGADVLVEGFRPGVVDRLGAPYEDIRAINPSIVYCSISGFGQTGPLRLAPGHDATYLAASGALAYPGSFVDHGPVRSGVPVSDLAASGYAVIAILGALYARRDTGNGCHLDLAISDAAMAYASVRAGGRLDITGDDHAHLHPANGVYTAADGRGIALGAVEEHFWARLRPLLAEVEPGLADARFDTPEDRQATGAELDALIQRAIGCRPADEWMSLLAGHDVPAQPVLSLAEAADNEQVQVRGVVAEAGAGRYVLFPVLRDGAPMAAVRSTPPELGAHTDEVLGALDAGRDPWLARS